MDARSRRVPSGAFDDTASIRSRAYPYAASQHRLRPAESRFSLREQFAVTRREFEFGFDDASSILERSTLASEAVRGDEFDDAVIVGTDPGPNFPVTNPVCRDFYELLCLSKETSLSPEQVRDAAQRLVRVLAADRQPPRLQGPAAFYLGLTQAAFETLAEPSRRLGYDLSGAGEADLDYDDMNDDDDEYDDQDTPIPESSSTYESRLQEQYLLLTQREARASSDVGLRIYAASLLSSQRGSRRQGSGLDVLDFSIRKSATVSVPALRGPAARVVRYLRELSNKGSQSLWLADPTVTITGATHGLLDEPFRFAPLLPDRYQPPGPSIHASRRMEQLLASRFLATLNLNFRQEVFWKPQLPENSTDLLPQPGHPALVIEQELELLPQPSSTLRLGHPVNLPGRHEPVHVEISVQNLLRQRSEVVPPNLGLAIYGKVGQGTAFLVADGADLNFRTSKECREPSKFSKLSGLAPMIDIFRNPPTVEAGYAFGRHDLGIQSRQAFTKPSERGLPAVDCDMDENKAGSWTISTGLTPGNAAAYLRYGKDLFASFTSKTPSSRRAAGGVRAEVELAGSVQRDFFLAFRALKCVGRFSKAGLEVGLSPSNLHLSLYWSRLGHRVSLPFLVSAGRARLTTATRLLFWTAVFPFAALAAWELYRQRQRAARAAAAKAARSTAAREKKVQEYVARRRAEADELTAVLATGVEPRQEAERRRSGLVIVSAKYGVRDAPPEEVADVTIALAALVDDGRLLIPRGVRKSRLLGFWDPAPGCTKVLRVRYLWQGKELAVEVSGREELRLP